MRRRSFLRLGSLASLSALFAVTSPSGPAAAQRQRIIVIGAGLAGLAAAQTLQNQGHEVVVLEARDRLGGRTWTSTAWPGAPLDLGASWIHGLTGNPLTTLARQARETLVTTSYENAILYSSTGKPLSRSEETQLAQIQTQISRAVTQAQDRDPDQALRSVVERALNWASLPPERRRMVDFSLNGTFEHEYAGSAEELSVHWFDDAAAFDGDDALFAQGYQSLVAQLATGLTVQLKQQVTAIDWSRSPVVVTTPSGTQRADKLIITLPLGVLKAGQVRFSPDLPTAKRTAIKALGMGVLNKCYLRFPRAFWPEQVDWIEQIAPRHGEWSEWVSFQRALKLPILLGFNAATYGRESEQLSDEQLVGAAMQVLRRIFGQRIPEPTAVQITRWHADPFARGSYSFNALGSTPTMRTELARPSNGRLFFAGEATEREHFSTAHGAYLSGLRAAREVLGGG